MINPKPLNVFDVASEVNHASETGNLTEDLLAEGNKLYGKSYDFPDLMERITPHDRVISYGTWRDGEFYAKFCLLKKSSL